MLRTDTSITLLLAAVLLPACDPGEPADAELLEAEIAQVDDEALPAPAPVGGLVAEPDLVEDQTCVNYFFATSQADTKKEECAVASPEPVYPVLIPVWDDLLYGELYAEAAAACAYGGASNSSGQLPIPELAGAPADGNTDALAAAPGVDGAAAPGPIGIDVVPEAAPAAPMCQTICEGYGKVWDYTAKNFGTCAFNRVVALQPPVHDLAAPACLAPNTEPWKMGGGILFDCGCRCV